jgi:hypothetical protein
MTKAKPGTVSIADAIYTAIYQTHGGTVKLVIKRASKLCGRTVTPSQLRWALVSFDLLGGRKKHFKELKRKAAAERGRARQNIQDIHAIQKELRLTLQRVKAAAAAGRGPTTGHTSNLGPDYRYFSTPK